ncbi:MAG: DUF4130 domain-containing protein [Candidatus Altiarchaeota archaeon]|nr:DUF4130 domain-containing protein [Candidatus Altiarchaeota archaeon]
MDCRSLLFFARRHRDFNMRLYRKVLSQNRELTDSCATPESKKLHRMYSSVSRCLCKAQGFTRLDVSGKTLYGLVDLEHDVMDLLLSHFRRRYPGYEIALENKKKTHVIDVYGGVKVHDMGVNSYLGLGTTPPDSIDPLFSTYYVSQNIRERRNTKLMDKMMPKLHSRRNHVEHLVNNAGVKITDYL